MSKPRTGHMMQLKRVARYLKGVPRKAQQCPAQEKSKAHLEVHVDSDLGRRHCNASKHDWSDRETWTTFAQTQLNGTKCDWSEQVAKSEYYALTEGGCSGLGLQSLFADWNLELQLSLHTHSSSEKATASRRGNWQEHSSHTDKDAMAAKNA